MMDAKLVAEARQVMKQFESLVALAKALSDSPGIEQEIASREKKRDSIRSEIVQVEGDMKRVWAEREKVKAEAEKASGEARDAVAQAKVEAKGLLDAAKAEGERLVAEVQAEAAKIRSAGEAAKKTLAEREKEIASAEARRDELLTEIEGLKKRFA